MRHPRSGRLGTSVKILGDRLGKDTSLEEEWIGYDLTKESHGLRDSFLFP